MANLKIWSRVLPGSNLELSASSTVDAFDVRARFLDTDGAEEVWLREEIVPGPRRRALRFPSVVRIAISFLTAEEQAVEINARIVKPNGDTHGEPYSETFTGKGGDNPARATIVVAVQE